MDRKEYLTRVADAYGTRGPVVEEPAPEPKKAKRASKKKAAEEEQPVEEE